MNIDHVNRAHSAKSHKSDLLSKDILQTTASLHHTHDALLNLPFLEAGLYFSLTLFNLLINSDASFTKITKRLEENKKKYDELSALVKPIDEVLNKMTQVAINYAGNPKFADPTTNLKTRTLSFERYLPFKVPVLEGAYKLVFTEYEQTSMAWLAGLLCGLLYEFTFGGINDAKSILGGWWNINTAVWSNHKVYTIDDYANTRLIDARNRCGTYQSDPIVPIITPSGLVVVNADKIAQLQAVLDNGSTLVSSDTNKQMICYKRELFKEGRSFTEIENLLATIKQKTSSYSGKKTKAFDPGVAVIENITTRKDIYYYTAVDYPSEYIAATPENYVITDDESQKIIDLVKHLQPSDTLTKAQLRDVSTALKLSELRSIVNDGNRKMLALNALNQNDLTIINEQTNNMHVLSEFFSHVISSINAMAGYFGARS